MKELNQIELFAKDHESITKEEKELGTKLIIGAKSELKRAKIKLELLKSELNFSVQIFVGC